MRKVKFLMIFFLMYLESCTTCEKWFEEHEKNNSYSGLVLGKYLDTSFNGRNEPMVILSHSQTGALDAFPVFNNYMFEMIDSGDYIFKDSGSLKRMLIKKSDTIIYLPQCGDGNDVESSAGAR